MVEKGYAGPPDSREEWGRDHFLAVHPRTEEGNSEKSQGGEVRLCLLGRGDAPERAQLSHGARAGVGTFLDSASGGRVKGRGAPQPKERSGFWRGDCAGERLCSRVRS